MLSSVVRPSVLANLHPLKLDSYSLNRDWEIQTLIFLDDPISKKWLLGT